MVKRLYSDAGTGFFIVLKGKVEVEHRVLTTGVYYFSVKKQAETVKLYANTRLAGIRFLPAIGYGVVGKMPEAITELNSNDTKWKPLFQLKQSLLSDQFIDCQLDTIQRWVEQNLALIQTLPSSVSQVLEQMNLDTPIGQLVKRVCISQRQLERQFQVWLDMTPKYFQRIIRVRVTVEYLKQYPNANMAGIAHQFGFSDQSHMIREFRQIAGISPRQIMGHNS